MGTAGSLSFNQGEIVECTSFVQRLPYKNSLKIMPSIEVEAKTKLKKTICGTGDFIEINECLTKCDVMDMEAYAMAYVCQQYQVPFTSIKYISDHSNENLLADWNRHLKLGAEALLENYKKYF